MRSLRAVPLSVSLECPRRALLIWEVEKLTCQRLSVATCCLAMTSWSNHLQWSAPQLVFSDAQLCSLAQLGPGSLLALSTRPDCIDPENPSVHFPPPFLPQGWVWWVPYCA